MLNHINKIATFNAIESVCLFNQIEPCKPMGCPIRRKFPNIFAYSWTYIKKNVNEHDSFIKMLNYFQRNGKKMLQV